MTWKTFAAFVAAVAIGFLASRPHEAVAGEDPLGAGCFINSTDAGAASSTMDSDCSWSNPVWLSLQCDYCVRYTKNGTWPTNKSPLVCPGDPYYLRSTRPSTTGPLRILPVDGGVGNCSVYLNDAPP